MSEFSELNSRVSDIEGRQIRLETKVESELASREWVREIVEPIKDTTRKIEQAVETIGKENQSLTAAHNKLLEDRAQRERKDFEEKLIRDKAESDAKIEALKAQTWSAIIQTKWQPLLVSLVALSTLIGLLVNYLSKV